MGYRVHSTAREWLAAVPPASPSFTAPRTTPLQLPDQDADMPASTHTPKVLGPRPVGPRLLAVGPKAPPIKVAPQAPIGPAPREPKHPKRPPPVPPGYFEGMHMEAVPRASQEVKAATPAAGDQAKQTPDPRPTYGSYQFNEEEVDWEHDDVEDDRTPEEKQEDAEILRQTKENMAAFLRAPPELKRTLRSQLWQCCCEKLRTLCLDPTPCHPHEGKFEADLRAGFSYQEAKVLQKPRDRAARHQAALAEMKGVSCEDFPKSWRDDTEPQRTLKPGFIQERNAKKGLKRQEKKYARGQHTSSRRSFSSASQSRGSYGAQPVTPEKAPAPEAPRTPAQVRISPNSAAESC